MTNISNRPPKRPSIGTATTASWVQRTATLVTSAPANVPDSLLAAQVWPVGWVATVSVCAVPSASSEKLKLPLEVRVWSPPQLICSTAESPPARPVKHPPTVKVSTVHVTVTLFTSPAGIVPLLFVTESGRHFDSAFAFPSKNYAGIDPCTLGSACCRAF